MIAVAEDKSTELVASEFGGTEGLNKLELQQHVRMLLRSAEGRWNPERHEKLLEHLSELATGDKMGDREKVRFAELLEKSRKNEADIAIRMLEIDAANNQLDPLILPPESQPTVAGPVQVNVFMPDNGRGPAIDVNGPSTNGQH